MELYQFQRKHRSLFGYSTVEITNENGVENIQCNEGQAGLGWTQIAEVRAIVNRIFRVANEEQVIENHIIKGDGTPRAIFVVSRLRVPLCGGTEENDIDKLIEVVKKLVIKKREYSSLQAKSVEITPLFYACIDISDDTFFPETFFVNESNICFPEFSESLQTWNCLSNDNLRVGDHRVVYAKFNKGVQLHTDINNVMLFFYLNVIRKKLCTSCDHVWSPEDFLLLTSLAEKYYKKLKKITEGSRGIVDVSAYQFQNKYKDCRLWIQYFKGEAFIEQRDSCTIS